MGWFRTAGRTRRRRSDGRLVRHNVTVRGRDFEVTEDNVGIVEVRIL
jgi:hypothetical protein